MTWVKVCGLTRPEDVALAAEAGADALGFNTIPTSPRAVAPVQVRDLAAGLNVESVVLVADLGVAEALRIVEETGVTGIQPYGNHALDIARAAAAADLFVLLPHHVAQPVTEHPTMDGVIPLFDTPSRLLGGTGTSFDWSLVAGASGDYVLAGGLGPANVTDAIRAVDPWGVDASSGLELEPGIKDPGKVIAFIEKAKAQ